MADLSSSKDEPRMNGTELVVGSARFPLAEIREVRTEREDPKLKGRLIAAALAVLGIPAVLYMDVMSDDDLSGLIALPVAIVFAVLGSIFASQSRYHLVLSTATGVHAIFSTRDRFRAEFLRDDVSRAVETAAGAARIPERA